MIRRAGRWWQHSRLPRLSRIDGRLQLLAIAVLASIALQGPSRSQAFTIDESRWIATSRYFWITFIDRDIAGPAWQPNYVVLTQPPVARYILGFGLWLQGWQPHQLNGRYDIDRSHAFNVRAGAVPTLQLLEAARRVELVVAYGAVVLLYLVGRQLAGALAGVAAVALVLVNPLLPNLWTRALAEAPLAFFSLLTLWLVLGQLRPTPSSPNLGAWLAAGTALGLAAATKLSGGIGALGLALFALIHQGAMWRAPRFLERPVRWMVLALAATATFWVVNPLLYSDPLNRTVRLVEHRYQEMQQQRITMPRQAVPDGPGARALVVAQRVYGDYPSIRLPGRPLWDGLLLAAGIATAGLVVARRGAPGDARQRHAIILCWVGANYVVTVLSLSFDSSHYYAPLVLGNILLEAIGVAAVVHALIGRFTGAGQAARG